MSSLGFGEAHFSPTISFPLLTMIHGQEIISPTRVATSTNHVLKRNCNQRRGGEERIDSVYPLNEQNYPTLTLSVDQSYAYGMTPKLSAEQRQAIVDHPDDPLVVIDDSTQRRYVLVPEDTYARLQAVVTSGVLDIRETYTAQEQAALAAGWDDPALDAYNDCDAHRTPQ